MDRPNRPIGEAARQSGIEVPAIRCHERIGLLPAPPRSEGNRRQHGAGDLRRLAFIRHAREPGFEVEAIRTMLVLQDRPEQSRAAVDEIARTRLSEVDRRIASPTALKAELERMPASRTHGRCRHRESGSRSGGAA